MVVGGVGKERFSRKIHPTHGVPTKQIEVKEGQDGLKEGPEQGPERRPSGSARVKEGVMIE